MMKTSTRPQQMLFVAALTLLLIAGFSNYSRGLAGKNTVYSALVSDQIHISKLWPWASGGNTWVREHIKRSERIYQTMVAQREQLEEDFRVANKVNKELFPCTSGRDYIHVPFTIWDWTTAAFNCPHSVQRIGRLGDGGKWICGLEILEAIPAPASPEQPSSCVVYSLGINKESSFEDALLARTSGCEIWGYDFTVDDFGPQLNRSAPYFDRAHFTRAGIAGKTAIHNHTVPFYSIQDLMEMNGHDHVDLLKMDIDGFEFDAVRSVISAFRPSAGSSGHKSNDNDNGKAYERNVGAVNEQHDYDAVLGALDDDGLGEVPISQFMIEIHLLPGLINNTPEFMDWWEMLEEAGFRATWTEPNLLVSTLPLFDGFPRFAEYTFLNVKDSKSLFTK